MSPGLYIFQIVISYSCLLLSSLLFKGIQLYQFEDGCGNEELWGQHGEAQKRGWRRGWGEWEGGGYGPTNNWLLLFRFTHNLPNYLLDAHHPQVTCVDR